MRSVDIDNELVGLSDLDFPCIDWVSTQRST